MSSIVSWYYKKYKISDYLRGEAILLWVSETASPTYLSPTSKPSKRPRFTAVDVSKSWNKFNGFTYLITQPDPSTTNNKIFYLSLCEIHFTQIKITKMNNMGNNIFNSKMQRNKLFLFCFFNALSPAFRHKVHFHCSIFTNSYSTQRSDAICDIFLLWHIFSQTLLEQKVKQRERFITSEIQRFRRSELPFRMVSMFQTKLSKWVQCLQTQLFQFMISSRLSDGV